MLGGEKCLVSEFCAVKCAVKTKERKIQCFCDILRIFKTLSAISAQSDFGVNEREKEEKSFKIQGFCGGFNRVRNSAKFTCTKCQKTAKPEKLSKSTDNFSGFFFAQYKNFRNRPPPAYSCYFS